MTRKGLILAGGNGTRLYPVTNSLSKHLLPVYNKPMVYYPLSTLMQSGIRDILIISTPRDTPIYHELLGDGSQWGINLSYAIQDKPEGLAQAFIIGADFIANNLSALILGDNIFVAKNLLQLANQAHNKVNGATIFSYPVADPRPYGVVELDQNSKIISIVEKPEYPRSNLAITGLYYYDREVVYLARNLRPSLRNELEITDLNSIYLNRGELSVAQLDPADIWFDAGTHLSLLEVSNAIAEVEQKQQIKIACPEEIAWQKSWINSQELEELINNMPHSDYRLYLTQIINSKTLVQNES